MRQGPSEPRARVGRRAATILAALALVATALPAQDVTQVSSKVVTTTTGRTVPVTTGVIDSKAVNALRTMGAYLRTLKSFGVEVKGAKDDVMSDGQKILISGTVNYLVRTPDRMRAEINTDRKQRTIYYNGKTMTLYAPRMHYYATVNAPPTVQQMLDTVRAKYGVELPISDLFLWGTPRDGVSDLTQARYIGPSSVDGIQTDQYAFRQEGTDWQIWIEQGSRPLPRRLVITSVDKPEAPQYFATMMWNLTANTDDANFVFTPPDDAKQIPWNQTTVASARKAP
jgi:hypothetical protein